MEENPLEPLIGELGLNPKTGYLTVWAPGSKKVLVKMGEIEHELSPKGGNGLFYTTLEKQVFSQSYQVQKDGGPWHPDPYHIPFFFTSEDEDLFAKGEHTYLHRSDGHPFTCF